MQPFPDRLAEAVGRKRSQLVVGLDPRLDVLPMELRGEACSARAAAASAVARFCKGIVDAVGPYVVAVKPQAAFFEALGVGRDARARGGVRVRPVDRPARDPGREARRRGLDLARVRGRVSSSRTRTEIPLADAITASPYLGLDAVEPFLAACRRHGAGVFFLVRTSNAGAADVQDAMLSDGRPLWQHLATLVHEWGQPLVGEGGMSSVGAVVGATLPARGLGGPAADAADAAAPARRRGAGRDPGRRRAGVHERPGKRARDRVSVGDLRVPRHGGGLARRGSRGRGAALDAGMGGFGLVTVDVLRNRERPRRGRRHAKAPA